MTKGAMNMTDHDDPRVFFAAERTLLAWNRTSISIMAFGFVIERFGVFVQFLGKEEVKEFQRLIAFSMGIIFIILGSFLSLYSILQYKRIIDTLPQSDIPRGYNMNLAMLTNGIVGILGLLLIMYLIRGFI